MSVEAMRKELNQRAQAAYEAKMRWEEGGKTSAQKSAFLSALNECARSYNFFAPDMEIRRSVAFMSSPDQASIAKMEKAKERVGNADYSFNLVSILMGSLSEM